MTCLLVQKQPRSRWEVYVQSRVASGRAMPCPPCPPDRPTPPGDQPPPDRPASSPDRPASATGRPAPPAPPRRRRAIPRVHRIQSPLTRVAYAIAAGQAHLVLAQAGQLRFDDTGGDGAEDSWTEAPRLR